MKKHIISATDLQPLKLNIDPVSEYKTLAKLSEEKKTLTYLQSEFDSQLRSLAGKLNKTEADMDTDSDGIYDFEEMDFLTESGLITIDDEGIAKLPTFAECRSLKGNTLFYVEQGLTRFRMYMPSGDFQERLDRTPILPINSDPTNMDGDGDGVADIEDAFPLKINEKMNYIFFDESYYITNVVTNYAFSTEAQTYETLYIKDNRTVTKYGINSVSEFKEKWNSMGNVNAKRGYVIDEVILIGHGNELECKFGDGSVVVNPGNDTDTTGNTVYLNTLYQKKINLLILSSCKSGNIASLDDDRWRNISWWFLFSNPDVKEVVGWDGTTSFIAGFVWFPQFYWTSDMGKGRVKYYRENGEIKYKILGKSMFFDWGGIHS